MWFSSSTKHVNLSIGLQTVQKLDVSNKLRSGMNKYLRCCATGTNRNGLSQLRRTDVPPLHVLSHFKTTKFEFIFTPRSRAKSHELLQTVDLLIREFNATQKVREVRMRGSRTRCLYVHSHVMITALNHFLHSSLTCGSQHSSIHWHASESDRSITRPWQVPESDGGRRDI